jgi:hypothetical protein
MSVRSPLPEKLHELWARINPGTRQNKTQKRKAVDSTVKLNSTRRRTAHTLMYTLFDAISVRRAWARLRLRSLVGHIAIAKVRVNHKLIPNFIPNLETKAYRRPGRVVWRCPNRNAYAFGLASGDLETLAPSAGPQLVRGGGTASIMCLPSTWFPSRNLDHRWTEHCVFLQGELAMPRTSTIVAPEHDTVADEAASAYRVVDFSGGPTGFNGNRISSELII